MTKILLIVHVLAAIIAVGPVTVAASMFPAAARRVIDEPGDDRARAVLRNLHRVCKVYALVGVAVPVFGIATANSLQVLGDTWLIVSMILTAAAAGILAALLLPRQSAVLEGPAGIADTRRLAMYTGIFNLLWAVVTVLMIVRPGSTTSV
ncbi:hypothetical protein [Streptomyces formicae]|uniref:Integral membrane protein n=1 Tax=Streptomyces formicae TaxID=1616117 RepID=A0ABY3WIW7_9ACTN|nr:hypothetical protein [Streptomyces formicae]UNM12529.1 hypothetical protein J4032_14200 [Streptomyces formicae]